jgi:crotonobetainyl-CoA:carnitine CoA-transferase CaiB-like acyl-CoA transferase
MLSHLKVVEIADTLGAYTGRILADLGAQVIKVEPPQGDPARATGVAWSAWNAGKAGARLDLDTDAGLSALKALLAEADILVQGGGDSLAAAGLDYDTLSATNPGLISVVVQPFMEDATLDGAPATDLTLMAMSGIMHIVGDPAQPPLKLPGEQAYALAGTQGAIAALLALNARAATGKGQRAVVSAYQSAVLAGYRDPIVWEWTGQIGRRTGNRLVRGKSGVRQVWQARDGFVTWSLVDNPGMVKGLVALMQAEGKAGPLADVDWDNTLLADAPQHQIEAWEAVIADFFAGHAKADLARASAEKGMGLSQIDTPQDALASPHWRARGFWTEVDGRTLPGPLFQTTAPQVEGRRPAPRLDEPSATGFEA